MTGCRRERWERPLRSEGRADLVGEDHGDLQALGAEGRRRGHAHEEVAHDLAKRPHWQGELRSWHIDQRIQPPAAVDDGYAG